MLADQFLLAYTIFSVSITVTGNGLIILCWIFDKSIRTSSNTLLVCLALFDFLTGALVTPTMYATNFFNAWTLGKVPCQLYLMFIYILFVLGSNTLVLIAIDRYRLLVEGVPYIQRRSPLTALKPVVLILFVAVWVQLDALLDFNDTILYTPNPDGTYLCVRNYRRTYGLLIILLDSVLPGISLICINTSIYRELKKRNQSKIPRDALSSATNASLDSEEYERRATNSTMKSYGASEGKARTEDILERQHSAAVTLTILTVAFLLLLLPYMSLNLLRAFFGIQLAPWMTTFTAYSVWANSLINPFVYAIRCNDFKRSFLKFKHTLFHS